MTRKFIKDPGLIILHKKRMPRSKIRSAAEKSCCRILWSGWLSSANKNDPGFRLSRFNLLSLTSWQY